MGDPPRDDDHDGSDRDARFEDEAPPPPRTGRGGGSGPPAPRQPLPVRETAAEVVTTFLDRARYLPTVALVPFTATFLAQGGLVLFGGNPLTQEGPDAANPLTVILAALVILAAYIVFLVDWHRLVLLGPGPATTRPRLRLYRRDLRFFGYGIVVGFLALVASLPVAFVAPGLGGTAGGGTLLLLIGLMLNLTATMALGLVLPAAATERNYSIGASFEATKAVLPQIAGLVALVLLPGLVIVAGVNAVYALLFGPSGPLVPGMLLSLALEYAMMALAATLMSVIFRRRAGVDLSA